LAKTMEETIQDAVRILTRELAPAKVVLFGSAVTGRFSADSDLDFLVIVKGAFNRDRSRYGLQVKALRALRDLELAKDVLVYNLEEETRYRNSLNHVVARALREGKVLYERD
jgi:uncharacterized protein